MRFAQGNNLPKVKASNQSSILQMIYHCGPIKRAEIAQQLELTLPTITTNVNNMIAAGLVREADTPAQAAGYPGRRARPVDIVPDSQHFIGIEMQGFRRVICILDFRGQMYYRCKDETPCRDFDENIRLSCGMIQQALQASGLSLSDIAGIGFCAPGLINSVEGILDVWPAYGWRSRNIRDSLAALTGYTGPIHVENNACVRAYGARLSQRQRLNNVPNFAYLFVAQGIACPLFLNTPNAFGSVVGAGEVGHMVMELNGRPCGCGNRGCLEAYSSNTAILAQCQEVLDWGGAPVLRQICPEGAEASINLLLEAQAAGDPDVCKIIDGAVTRIGVALANLINFACPRIMFIDGELFQAEQNRQQLMGVTHRNLCNVIRTDTEFFFVEPDEYSGARGAAALAICKNLEAYGE